MTKCIVKFAIQTIIVLAHIIGHQTDIQCRKYSVRLQIVATFGKDTRNIQLRIDTVLINIQFFCQTKFSFRIHVCRIQLKRLVFGEDVTRHRQSFLIILRSTKLLLQHVNPLLVLMSINATVLDDHIKFLKCVHFAIQGCGKGKSIHAQSYHRQ